MAQMTQTDTHLSMLQVLQSVRKMPPPPEGGPGQLTEMPPVLGGLPIEETPVSTERAEATEMAVPVQVKHHARTYLLWRPYESCKRCQEEFDRDQVILPTEGDYTCPHVQTEQYRTTMSNCLSGKGTLLHKEHFMLQDGRRLVLVEWAEIDPEFKKEQDAKAKEALRNSIAPSHLIEDEG